jgi:catechol 2,3-dioxygenase-like lactoylglutathione lyase family enzyme
MPITDRSTKDPLIKVQRIGHGTLEVIDLQATRKFYEEVLGLHCSQTSMVSMIAELGTDHVYAVVQTGNKNKPAMNLLNHNGLDVESDEEVDRLYKVLTESKDEWGIREIKKPSALHGDYSFYFLDLDGNWWEIGAVGPGYFDKDPLRDLTGLHEFDDVKELLHTHKADTRVRVQAVLDARAQNGNSAPVAS